MQSPLLAALLFLPFCLSAQTYTESIFAPGAVAANAEPLTTRADFKIHARRAVGTEALLFSVGSAGLNELRNNPPAWTRDGTGLAKRFGSGAGSNGIRQILGFGLDEALHTDPRVYRSTRTSFGKRLSDALSQVVVTRTDAGGHTIAISNIGSAFAAGEIQTMWMPAANAHAGDGLVNAGILLLGDAARDVAREFWPDVRRKLKREN